MIDVKKIINNGLIVRFLYKKFELKGTAEERDWHNKEVEICESCFNNLLIFLGDDITKVSPPVFRR